MKLNKIKLAGPNLRALILPASLIVALIVLALVAIPFAYSNISARTSQLNESRHQEERLDEKVEVLREFQEGILERSSDVAVALSDRNLSTWSISHFKKMAEDSGLTITNIELGSARSHSEESYSQAELEIELTGDLISFVDFVRDTSEIAPLTLVSQGEMQTSQEQVEGIAKFSVYWAPLPESLPPITEPVKQLTADEQRLLDEVTALKQPEFVDLSPTGLTDRESPFD